MTSTLPPRLITGARIVVRIALYANRAFLVAVVAALLASWLFASQFDLLVATMLPGGDTASAVTGARLEMLLGIALAVATDRLFVALSAIVETTRSGDPFVPANATRLNHIGWCLVAVQLADLPAALIAHYYPALGPAAPDGAVGLAGWVAVIMVFVLARVFAVGADMRDDLAGTV